MFRIEYDIGVSLFLDILFSFIADGKLAQRASRVSHVNIEPVLMTVQRHDGKLFRIGRKLDARDIAVGIQRQIHFAGNVALDVVRMYAHLRVDFSCLRVLVLVRTRISGILVLFGRHTLVPREAVHRYLTLVETDISNHLAVGTEVERTVERKLFLVHPVGDTVQHLIVFTVLSDLRFTVAKQQLDQKNVVVADESYLKTVGREQRHLLRSVFRKRFHLVVSHVEDVIFGRKRMTVDRFRFRLDQNQFLVGRHDVVVERLDRTISCRSHVEYRSYLLARLERVFHDTFLVSTHLRIKFAVQHRLDAVDVLCTIGTLCHILEADLTLCLHSDDESQQAE